MMDVNSLLDPSPSELTGYDVVKHLGSGATADVFQVVAKSNGRSYVVKQMALANMTDEERLRAKQEILVMDGVGHPNVVKFHESFGCDTCADIVMEYCEGGTLEDLIERQRYEGKPFPEDILIEWMAELLCALAHIHSKRILHRDLKTSNIFVTAKNHLKLGDFGVCTILTNANAKAESMIGTPLYFAPEVCENEAYDERSDVWSLGIVFYEMCTLRRPFEADNLFTLIQRILTQEVAPFNTGLEMTFEAIVRTMLSKNPRDRPTAQELIDNHLNVPKSHPSHPSQKPSRSRLIQQYYGPELKYAKPWPPAQAEPTANATVNAPPVQAAAAAASAGARKRVDKPARVRKNGHNDAGDYINDEKDRELYLQLMNQTMGATTITTAVAPAAAPAATKTTKSAGRFFMASAAVLNTTSASTCGLGTKSKKVSSSTANAQAPSGSSSSAAKASKATAAVAASARPKSSSGACANVKGATAPTRPATAMACSNGSGTATTTTATLAASQMDELKLDVARRQTEMFGEGLLSIHDAPVVIEIQEAPLSASGFSVHTRSSSYLGNSATVRLSSTFFNDIVAVLDRHSAHGKKIKLEDLDDAAQLLNQIKFTNYGLL